MQRKPQFSDVLIGILIGFALSASFFVIWGAFQWVGFFLWSIVAGGGGAVVGRGIFGSRVGVILTAVVVRLAIFVLFGGIFL
ncbi:MAG TPA: hypothetical protein VJ932_02970 [Alkalispirochaeta sp.]|nr:hypothetical protein [Alkalispirochaeta sp.]